MSMSVLYSGRNKLILYIITYRKKEYWIATNVLTKFVVEHAITNAPHATTNAASTKSWPNQSFMIVPLELHRIKEIYIEATKGCLCAWLWGRRPAWDRRPVQILASICIYICCDCYPVRIRNRIRSFILHAITKELKMQ